MVEKKQITVDISEKIYWKTDSKKITKAVQKYINNEKNLQNYRRRLRFYVDENTHKKLKNIKKETKKPLWKIVEEAILQFDGETKEVEEVEGKEKHIPPTNCPICDGTDLLISNNNTWFCYDCEENGEF